MCCMSYYYVYTNRLELISAQDHIQVNKQRANNKNKFTKKSLVPHAKC